DFFYYRYIIVIMICPWMVLDSKLDSVCSHLYYRHIPHDNNVTSSCTLLEEQQMTTVIIICELRTILTDDRV
ncbi:hypothetical protein L9F63_003779, partial [Diploptera punctata]